MENVYERFGLVKNHAMIDGNKRLGAHVMPIFPALNGYELTYGQRELSDIIPGSSGFM